MPSSSGVNDNEGRRLHLDDRSQRVLILLQQFDIRTCG